MVLENQLVPHFSFMNSPQPLSALQRGAKIFHSPFFCRQENRACGIDEVNGAGGLSSCNLKISQSILLLIPDSHYKYLIELSEL
jgi:hypothetical protein